NTFEISYVPGRQRDTTYSVFGEYEVNIVPDKFRLIGGSKFEHNPYTGFEVQPQVRGVWTPTKTSTFWGAVSRAVREPDRLNNETNLKVSEPLSASLPVFATIIGNPSLASEIVRAYELGYRVQPKPSVFLDLALFYNHYENLVVTSSPGTPTLHPGYIE